MHVVATAGHVDHGKSTLVRALTGIEPDRWAEERRRGMTIDLGFAWMTLPSGAELAFVDVPGHQRFVTNMLAGVGPAPAVMFVVAADEGWRRQSAEHLDAVHALGIRHGLLVVTRSDLAEPAPMIADALHRLRRTSLGTVESVAVSGRTGAGLPALRDALDRLVAGLPTPTVAGRVRLWVDRSFTIRGRGTVVTGTLGAGCIRVGDELQLRDRRITVRGIQQLGRPADTAHAVARVAVNLRSTDANEVRRGDTLLTPDSWHWTDVLDVRLEQGGTEPPAELTLHIGSEATAATVRLLSPELARLTLRIALPLQVGDRVILRDPAAQRVVAGAVVLDVDPLPFHRRGAARLRAAELAALTPEGAGGPLGVAAQVRRRSAVRVATLAEQGFGSVVPAGIRTHGDWLVDPTAWRRWGDALKRLVGDRASSDDRQPGVPASEAARLIGLPDPDLIGHLVADAGLKLASGRVSPPGAVASLGSAEAAVRELERRWAVQSLDAPERGDLNRLGLTNRDLAAAERAGRALRLGPDLVVGPAAAAEAAATLRNLPQPFTTSQARQELGTTRRIAVPLLEHFDRIGLTRRLDATMRVFRRAVNAP